MASSLQLGVFYALLAGVIWGISPLLFKRGLLSSNVSTGTLIEQTMSVVTLLVIVTAQTGLALPEISAKALLAFVAAGAVGASFGKIFYYKGIDKVGASKATSAKNSSPLLTAFLAVIVLGEELTFLILTGVILIVAGILVLTRVETKGEERGGPLGYFLYPLVAAACFGVNPIFKKLGVDTGSLPTVGAAIAQITGLAVMLTAGRFLNVKPKWERVPALSFFYFGLAGILEALGSLFTFYALIHAPAILVSPIWRISPLVTFVLARFTLRGIEVVTFRDGVAASFIVCGIFVLTWG
ncbi:MAG: DMT family transporter [Deltaproteobacteria bacterium]|nr:DMT family transporter [Deltaproteobacteria bacterium]